MVRALSVGGAFVKKGSVSGPLVGKELGSVSVVPSEVVVPSVSGALVLGTVSVVIVEVGSDSVSGAFVGTDVTDVTVVTDVGSLSVDDASDLVTGGVVEVIFGTAA